MMKVASRQDIQQINPSQSYIAEDILIHAERANSNKDLLGDLLGKIHITREGSLRQAGFQQLQFNRQSSKNKNFNYLNLRHTVNLEKQRRGSRMEEIFIGSESQSSINQTANFPRSLNQSKQQQNAHQSLSNP